MSADALSNKQFNTERFLLSQGNEDDLATRVRGIQNMTSNIFRPSFSSDYGHIHAQPSGTEWGEGEEDEGA